MNAPCLNFYNDYMFIGMGSVHMYKV